MTEQAGGKERELAAFKERYQEGLQDFLMFLEETGDYPLSPEPFSMGLEERTFEELSL